MAVPDQPIPSTSAAEMAAWKQDVERRIKNLETGSGMINTSVRGGTTIWTADDTGHNLVLFGVFGDGDVLFEGFIMYDGNERAAFMTRADKPGIVHPHGAVNFVNQTETFVTTSATFEIPFIWDPGFIYWEQLHVAVGYTTDSGTTGEVRLREVVTNQFTDVATLPAASGGFAVFDWQHQLLLPARARFEIRCRRTAGSGNVTIFHPYEQWVDSSALNGAGLPNGNPRVV